MSQTTSRTQCRLQAGHHGPNPQFPHRRGACLGRFWDHRQIQSCPYDLASNWWGASDASAHPDGNAHIGGWLADTENLVVPLPSPTQRRPCAHKDGDPTRRIAAPDLWHPDSHLLPLIQRGEDRCLALA